MNSTVENRMPGDSPSNPIELAFVAFGNELEGCNFVHKKTNPDWSSLVTILRRSNYDEGNLLMFVKDLFMEGKVNEGEQGVKRVFQLPSLFREIPYDEQDEAMKKMNEEFASLFAESYFKKLYQEAPAEIKAALMVNYRMHGLIMRLVNFMYPAEFQLVHGIDDANRPNAVKYCKNNHLLPRYNYNDLNIQWINTSRFRVAFAQELLPPEKTLASVEQLPGGWIVNEAYHPPGSPSLINRYELKVTRHILDQIVQKFVRNRKQKQKIMLISLYADQTEQLRTIADEVLERHISIEVSPGNEKNPLSKDDVEVFTIDDLVAGTVDAFQGREAGIVILNLTTTDPSTFARNRHRITVALSRAKNTLIIVGSATIWRKAVIEVPTHVVEKESGKQVDKLERKHLFNDIINFIDDHGGKLDANDVLGYIAVSELCRRVHQKQHFLQQIIDDLERSGAITCTSDTIAATSLGQKLHARKMIEKDSFVIDANVCQCAVTGEWLGIEVPEKTFTSDELRGSNCIIPVRTNISSTPPYAIIEMLDKKYSSGILLVKTAVIDGSRTSIWYKQVIISAYLDGEQVILRIEDSIYGRDELNKRACEILMSMIFKENLLTPVLSDILGRATTHLLDFTLADIVKYPGAKLVPRLEVLSALQGIARNGGIVIDHADFVSTHGPKQNPISYITTTTSPDATSIVEFPGIQPFTFRLTCKVDKTLPPGIPMFAACAGTVFVPIAIHGAITGKNIHSFMQFTASDKHPWLEAAKVIITERIHDAVQAGIHAAPRLSSIVPSLLTFVQKTQNLRNAWDGTVTALLDSLTKDRRFLWAEAQLHDWLLMAIDMFGQEVEKHDAFKKALEAAIDHMNESGERIDKDERIIESAPRTFLAAIIERAKSPNKFPGEPHAKLAMILDMIAQLLKKPSLAHVAASIDVNEFVPVLEQLHVVACPAIITDRAIDSIRLIDDHYTDVCTMMTPISAARASWRAHVAALVGRPGFMEESNEACIFACAVIAAILPAPLPSTVQSEIPPPVFARRPFLTDCLRVIDNEMQRTEARSFPILRARLNDEKRQLLALWDSRATPVDASDAEVIRQSCSGDTSTLKLVQLKLSGAQGKKSRRPASIAGFSIKTLKGSRLAQMLSALIATLSVMIGAIVLLLRPHLQEAIFYANTFISADLEASITWLTTTITLIFMIPISISVIIILYHARRNDERYKRILQASGRDHWKRFLATRVAVSVGIEAILALSIMQLANTWLSSSNAWIEPINLVVAGLVSSIFASMICVAPAKQRELRPALSEDDTDRARSISIVLLIAGVVLVVVGGLFQVSQFQNHHARSSFPWLGPVLLASSVTCIALGSAILLVLYVVPRIRRRLHAKRPAILRSISATLNHRPKFLVMGIAVLVGASVTAGLVVSASLQTGAALGARTSTGGDVALGDPASFLGNDRMIYSTAEIASIVATTSVDSAAIVTNACRYRIAINHENPKNNWASLGQTIDGAGWKTLPIGMSGIKVGIIDPSTYLAINTGSYYKITAPANAGLDTIMNTLGTVRSIILSDELQPVLQKQPGDMVRLVLDGVAVDVEIAAYVDVIPGFPWTMGLTSAFGSAASDQITGCGVISWATYLAATSGAFRGADILLKNKYWQTGSTYIDGISPGYYGTVGFPVNRTAVAAVLAPYLANGTVIDAMAMVNDPWPCLLEFYNDRSLEFDRVNTTGNRWNPWNASLVAIDTSKPAFFSGARIAAVHGDVSTSARGNIGSVLAWWRENRIDLPCIVPSIATAFTPDIVTGDPRLRTVYRLQPGDSIRCLIYGREVSFTVAATLDAVAAHDYVQDVIWHRGSPLVVNPVSLSFHPYRSHLLEDKGINGLSDVLSLAQDAVIIATEDHRAVVLGNIMSAINATRLMNTTAPAWVVGQSTNYLTTSLCNATFKFSADPLDYATLFRLQLPATANATDLAARIGRALARYPATQNMTAIAPREAYFAMTRFDKGHALLGLTASGRELAPSRVVTALGNAHMTAGLPFHDVQVKVAGLVAPAIETIIAAADITSVLSWIISITGIVAATIMATAATSRPSAFIGAVLQQHPVPSIKRRSVRITASITGIDDTLGGFIGLGIGFLTGWLLVGILIGPLPFIPAFPVLFTMPWGEIGAAFGVMVAIIDAIELGAVRARIRSDQPVSKNRV
nr:AAA domain-containing protein [Candidatus Sigynarchaeota archaeon]